MANKGLGRGFASLMGMNDIDELTQPTAKSVEIEKTVAQTAQDSAYRYRP